MYNKVIYIKIFLFLFFCNHSFSQTEYGIAVYGVKKAEAIFNNKNLSQKELLQTVEAEIEQNLPYLNFSLKFNGNEAVFEVQKAILDNGDRDRGKRIAFVIAQGYNKFYYNTKTDTIIMQTDAYGTTFRIFSKFDDLSWDLLPESKMIDGFLCYKAVTSYTTVNEAGSFIKKVIAWYAPNLPNPYGPAGFAGLPGLILELRDNKLLYYLKKISFKEKYQIEKFEKGKIVTKEELENFAFENANFRN
ncbi:MAG: GLPGLI family protein [Flavobacteriaceae bacterium]|nr:GLPGLI family protein [Flavobacteriaceae bacterium]